jgi:hypothetical protein
MIREKQKKSMVEWIGLVRSALIEVDDAMGRNVIVLEDQTEPIAFEDFRKVMERIALDLEMAKNAFPLSNGTKQKQEKPLAP